MSGSRRTTVLARAGAAITTATAVAAALAAPAAATPTSHGVRNPYSPAYSHAYRHGVVPTIGQQAKMRNYARSHTTAAATAATGPQTLSYGGGVDGIGVTSGTPKVYLVFWGTQWGTQGTDASGNLTFSNDAAGGAPYLQKMFKGLGTGGELWSGTDTQYCDGAVASGATTCPSGAAHVGYPTGGAYAGVWYDNSAAEPSAATGAQLGTEAVKAAGHFGNTTAASNRYAQYVVLSAKGLNPDNYKTGGFCAWHDYNGDVGAASSYGDIAFTNMPYVMDQGSSCGQGFVNSPGTLDGYSMVEGHEYAETITDQNPAGGWTNHVSGSSSNGEENADECAWISSGQGASANVTMGNGTYTMQSTWSNDTNRCDLTHPIVGGGSTGNTVTVTNPGSQSGKVGHGDEPADQGERLRRCGADLLGHRAPGRPVHQRLDRSGVGHPVHGRDVLDDGDGQGLDRRVRPCLVQLGHRHDVRLLHRAGAHQPRLRVGQHRMVGHDERDQHRRCARARRQRLRLARRLRHHAHRHAVADGEHPGRLLGDGAELLPGDQQLGGHVDGVRQDHRDRQRHGRAVVLQRQPGHQLREALGEPGCLRRAERDDQVDRHRGLVPGDVVLRRRHRRDARLIRP